MASEHIEDRSPRADGAAPKGWAWRPLPMAVLAALLVLAVAFAPTLWRTLGPSAPAVPMVGAPWQVEPLPGGGIRVFELDLPGTTLADARRRWGAELAVAVMARRDEVGAIEAYVERHNAGGIEGRLVLSWAADETELQRWRSRIEAERLAGGTLRYALDSATLDAAGGRLLVGVTFLSNAALTEDMVRGRFGEPGERARAANSANGATHWLYPAIGLAVLIDPEGKDVFQYVAPAEFDSRLRAPLRR